MMESRKAIQRQAKRKGCNLMSVLQPLITTLEEYEALPEDVRTEVFDGQIIQYSFEATIKVNIYDDLYINFAEIAELLSM